MTTSAGASAREHLERWAGRGLGAIFELDERLVDRVDPPSTGALDAASPTWAATLVAGWPAVRAELDQLLDDGVVMPETSALVGADQGAEGRWTTYVMGWYGTWLEANCARCPRTAALLAQVPDVQVAGFTVLDGHTHLPRHQGPVRSLRWQMGIKVPEPPGSCRLRIGDDTVVWEDRATLAFDDRTEHEAWNDADEPRYVLFVQVAWPVAGLTRFTHRAAHGIFGTATRRIPKQAAALDGRLNPDPLDPDPLNRER